MALRRLGGPHAGRGGGAVPRRLSAPGPTRRSSHARRGGETLADVRAAGPGRRSRRAAAPHPRARRLPGRARHLRARPHPGGARARPAIALWSLQLASTGISELEFRADWTALHRMNTLHAPRRAFRRPLRAGPERGAHAPADVQLPKGAKIYLPDEAATQARGGGAPARRLPPLGLSRGGDARLRVLRRALPGHRPRAAGAHVQDGGPRERAPARPARGHHAPDRAHRGHADAGRAQAPAPRLRHQRLPLRRAAGGPLPRVLPGGRGADRAAQPRGRRRDDRDDGGRPARPRPRASSRSTWARPTSSAASSRIVGADAATARELRSGAGAARTSRPLERLVAELARPRRR